MERRAAALGDRREGMEGKEEEGYVTEKIKRGLDDGR